GRAPIAGGEAEGKALRSLRAPLRIDVVQAGSGYVTEIEEASFTGVCAGFANTVEVTPIDREVGGNFVATGDALFFFARNTINFLGTGFRHFKKVVKVLFISVVTEADAGEGADFQVSLLASQEVTGFGADFRVGETRLGVLHDELRDPVFAAVVVDEVARAEFAEGDGT